MTCIEIFVHSVTTKMSHTYAYVWNNVTGINTIVKTCSVKKTTIASKFKNTCINKPPLPTDVFEFVNTPISCLDTTDIDYVEESDSYNLRDIAKCSTLPYENIPSSELLGDKNSNNTYMCQETLRHITIWLSLLFWTNTSTPSELLTNKIIVIWILWSSYSFRFLEQSVIISNLIQVRKIPYPNFYLK